MRKFFRPGLVIALLCSVLVCPAPATVAADPAGVTVPRYYVNLETEWTSAVTSFVDVQPSPGLISP